MSNFTQYADHNFYFKNYSDNSKYKETLDREKLVPSDHPHADEIIALMSKSYRPEDLPSNGSIEGYIGYKPAPVTDTRDLAEQASNPRETWASMMLAYQNNIRKLARWTGNTYNPETKQVLIFNKRVAGIKSRMSKDRKFAQQMKNKYEVYKMKNKKK